MSVTGIRRGEGWRAVTNTVGGDLPAVVRYLSTGADERATLCGSGSIIGNLDGRWLITATAASVLAPLNLPPQGPVFASGGLERRYGPEPLRALRCAVTVPERNGELLCPVAAAVVGLRDTALLFVPLPQPTPTTLLPVDLGPAPAPEESLLVAGFVPGEAGAAAAVPPRRLMVREGFYGDFGVTSARHPYPLLRHLVPLEPTMIGGPVIAQREHEPGRALRTLIGINAEDIPQVMGSAAASPHKEGEGLATHALALYAHTVLLPAGLWISFTEAVRRGVVSSYGPEAQRVAPRSGTNGALEYYIAPAQAPA